MRERASPSGGLFIHNIIITAYCYITHNGNQWKFPPTGTRLVYYKDVLHQFSSLSFDSQNQYRLDGCCSGSTDGWWQGRCSGSWATNPRWRPSWNRQSSQMLVYFAYTLIHPIDFRVLVTRDIIYPYEHINNYIAALQVLVVPDHQNMNTWITTSCYCGA